MGGRGAPKANESADHALLGQPDLAELAALLFGGTAPDPGLLVGGEGELEALLVDRARAADPAGGLDLLDRGAAAPDREEHVGVGVEARRTRAPRADIPVVRANPGQCHASFPQYVTQAVCPYMRVPGRASRRLNPRLISSAPARKGLIRNFTSVVSRWHGERDARARAPRCQ